MPFQTRWYYFALNVKFVLAVINDGKMCYIFTYLYNGRQRAASRRRANKG